MSLSSDVSSLHSYSYILHTGITNRQTTGKAGKQGKKPLMITYVIMYQNSPRKRSMESGLVDEVGFVLSLNGLEDLHK